MLKSSSSVINDSAINALVSNTKKAFLDKGIATEIVDNLIPEAEQLRTYFSIEQGSFGNEITRIIRKEYSKPSQKISAVKCLNIINQIRIKK